MWPSYTDDPAADWDAYCRKQDEEAKKLPYCDECGKQIEDERLIVYYGTIICEDCIENKFRKWTDDYMEE